MRRMKRVLSVAVALALGVCASTSSGGSPPQPTYEAAPGLDTSGWLTANADDGRYTVVYTGAPGMKREQVADSLVREQGRTLIPPFNHPHIMAGQGTATKELIEEVGPLDWLVVPCGGAGSHGWR